ncbi:hypothetical protein HPP92_012617 [Vanilla planifolia]|uniref:Uncharacterized protein n=1 Tax=Vanilla planifolia TaxID=51239 RepID=A0A835QZT0_VANPL|nr:hypothetical protein HPP92_012617 [Vanilla planifolia]
METLEQEGKIEGDKHEEGIKEEDGKLALELSLNIAINTNQQTFQRAPRAQRKFSSNWHSFYSFNLQSKNLSKYN